MSIRGEKSGKGKAEADKVPKRASTPNLIPGDLKLKLSEDFNRNKSRLKLFLA